ncbi:MAG: PorP/SprF family type IX secretion system membrane protein [Brumimicrobium sp.]
MKKWLFLILFFIPTLTFGQQVSQYSQWSYNQFSINPALAGIKRCLEVKLGARAQWAGFDDAPVSGMLTINAPLIKNKKKFKDFFHGIGGKIERDQFGPFNNFSMSLAYAIHIPLGKTETNHRLSFGVGAGIQQFGFDQTKTTTIDPDPSVSQSANNLLFPLITFGGWYYSDLFYLGAAVDQLAMNNWKDVGYASRFRLHTKIQAGTRIGLPKENSLLPGILFRIPPAGPMSFDVNLMFDYQNIFSVGLGYRNRDAVIGLFKVNIRQFTIGYSFDFITSSIRGGNFHTHEISIQFSGCRKGKPTRSACPLFE